jgi:hypothetical protein
MANFGFQGSAAPYDGAVPTMWYTLSLNPQGSVMHADALQQLQHVV